MIKGTEDVCDNPARETCTEKKYTITAIFAETVRRFRVCW